MKPMNLALLAVGGVVLFLVVRQMNTPPPAAPPQVNPTGGYLPGGSGGGNSDFQAGANAFSAFFNAAGSIAQAVAKNA